MSEHTKHGTCIGCAKWERANHREMGYSLGFGRCSAAPLFYDATEWNGNGDGRKLTAEYENTKAFVQDASDYKAELLTLPDFGCVSWTGNANVKVEEPVESSTTAELNAARALLREVRENGVWCDNEGNNVDEALGLEARINSYLDACDTLEGK